MSDAYGAPEQDVVLSSRVRLARNYDDIPFAVKMSEDDARETVRRATLAVERGARAGGYRLIKICELNDYEKKRLVEKHLISYDLLKYELSAAALISDDDTVSIMVNEEDHLRIQALLCGLQLEKAAQSAFEADDMLGARDAFAFDSKWGFLTSCPTNAGTGMRASVMLHLPALTQSRKIGAVIQAVGKLAFTVRGLYGEGSEAEGNLYQLSNQVTLGRGEDDVINSLNAVCRQLVMQEREERKALAQADADAFTDRIMRAVGLLLNARMMDEKEFMRLCSDLRMAVCVGLIRAPLDKVDELITDMQPGALRAYAGKPLNEREDLRMRADEVRARLAQLMRDN